jgi:hypothetical protein
MKKLISWFSLVPLGMAIMSVLYCCEILTSFHGRPAVPMTTNTHIIYITWTATALFGGAIISFGAVSRIGKSVAIVGSLLAAGALSVWLSLIYLRMLLPYNEVHQI